MIYHNWSQQVHNIFRARLNAIMEMLNHICYFHSMYLICHSSRLMSLLPSHTTVDEQVFLAHGWHSHAMGFWRHSNGTRSLTHSILINLFIKVRLNTLLLPPLLSITFFPSAFYVYVWNILEGTSKANFFPDTSIIEMGFV